MSKLTISPDLKLPQEAVTQTFGIVAKRGVTKTNTSVVITEEMLRAGHQVVIADPVGVWWGLRAAANGKDPGLPIIVMGGDHGDVPLELEIVVAAHPNAIDREAISDATSYKRSSRDTYLQRLGARKLITTESRGAVRAAQELFA